MTNENRFPLRTSTIVAFAAGLLVVPFTSQEADAATYEVWTCRAPDGSAAATTDVAGGWRSEGINVNPGGGNQTANQCPSGGALVLRHAQGGPQPTPSSTGWIFDAPAATTVAKYSLNFGGYARPGGGGAIFGEVALHTDLQSDPDYNERYLESGVVPRHEATHNGNGARRVHVRAACGDLTGSGQLCGPGADGAPAQVDIFRGIFTLDDRDAPAVGSVSGDALTDNLWAGATGISVGATDQGGGVYRLGVEVDGQIRSWQNLAAAPCAAWPGTERTFVSPKPCPSSVGGVQRISTAELPDGVHTVRVLVEDAAGNQTTAYGPVTKTLRRTADGTPLPGGDGAGAGGRDGGAAGGSVSDPGPLNGTPASTEARLRSRWTGREGASRTIRFNQRPKLDGQLTTTSGQPIVGAYVRVTITRDARNSPSFARDSLQTDKNGRFRWTLPTGISSRSIRLTYHQRVNDTKPVATSKLQLRVLAPVRLTLSRKTVRRGQTVKLTGTVVGRPVPGGGKLVELQARNPGKRWITFRTVRSRKSGKFAATYRFRNGGPAKFQMRARARKSGDYPYATGSSPARTIKVR